VLTDVEDTGTGGGAPPLVNALSISRIPLIRIRLLRRFFSFADPPPCTPLSSDGRVMVLFIASPHRHSRFTVFVLAAKATAATSSGISSANDSSGTPGAGLSISLRRRSCR
jgi:hypothetical protein